MFGRRSRSRMSGVEGRVRSVKMLNDKASRQQVTDKLTRNTTNSTHDCSNSYKSNMRTKSCSRAKAAKMTNSAKK